MSNFRRFRSFFDALFRAVSREQTSAIAAAARRQRDCSIGSAGSVLSPCSAQRITNGLAIGSVEVLTQTVFGRV